MYRYFLLFIVFIQVIIGTPLENRLSESENTVVKVEDRSRSRARREVSHDDAVKYLHQFGYLPPAHMMTAGFGAPNLDTAKEKLREAIRRFQRIADIPETGMIDETTREKMAEPRCGVPDVAALSYGRAALKWDKTQLTYSISEYSSDLPKDLIKKATSEAFNFWSRVSPLNFREIASNGDIKIGFKVGQHDDAYPFDGQGGVLAHALYPKIGRLHFDDDEKWTYKDAGQIQNDYTDLLHVAIHEIGHALGVDHIENKNSIMYFSYKEPIDRYGRYIEPSLHALDVAAIQKLYGKRQQSTPTRRTNTYNDEVMIEDADLTPSNSGGATSRVKRCPSKVDAIVQDGSMTLIFEGKSVFMLDSQRRIVKEWEIHDIFPEAPNNIQAVVLDYSSKKLILFERGGNLHAYFHSEFLNRYMKAYRKHMPHYHELSGAFSFKSGNTILFDKRHRYAMYNARFGTSGVFKNIDFENFPRDIRGAIPAAANDEKFYFFTQNRVFLYNTDEEMVENEKPLHEWIDCR